MTAAACCFCEDAIEDPEAEGVIQLVVSWASTEQLHTTWWAHEECFRKTLHPRVRNFPPPSELSGLVGMIEQYEKEHDAPSIVRLTAKHEGQPSIQLDGDKGDWLHAIWSESGKHLIVSVVPRGKDSAGQVELPRDYVEDLQEFLNNTLSIADS